MDVSIIIVNYNTVELTKNCLQSIYEKTNNIDYEVIVIDNASVDDSVNMIKSEFANVKLIENPENLGFGRANNLGIKISKGKYVFLLNSDTLLLNNAVKIFYDYMEINNKNNKIGALGSYMLDSKGNCCHSFGDIPSYFFLIKRYLNSCLSFTIFNFQKKINDDTTKDMEVGYVCGADLFVQKEVLNKLNGFDERFFLYYEETELQYRMMLHCYKRIIIPDAKIIHLEGSSFNLKINRRILNDRSMFLFLTKHNRSYFKYFIFKYIYLLFSIPAIILKYGVSEIFNYLSNYITKCSRY